MIDLLRNWLDFVMMTGVPIEHDRRTTREGLLDAILETFFSSANANRTAVHIADVVNDQTVFIVHSRRLVEMIMQDPNAYMVNMVKHFRQQFDCSVWEYSKALCYLLCIPPAHLLLSRSSLPNDLIQKKNTLRALVLRWPVLKPCDRRSCWIRNLQSLESEFNWDYFTLFKIQTIPHF